MHRRLPLLILALLTAAAGTLLGNSAAHATEVWSGRTFAFAKAPFADFTQAANQDRITGAVWLTRASTQGLFNIKYEVASGGSFSDSPYDTEWADGDAANYGSLAFANWVTWAGNIPPSTVGRNACLHLISDDIYIDIVFDSWGAGPLGGGGFSYRRAVRPNPTATTSNTWGRLKALYR